MESFTDTFGRVFAEELFSATTGNYVADEAVELLTLFNEMKKSPEGLKLLSLLFKTKHPVEHLWARIELERDMIAARVDI